MRNRVRKFENDMFVFSVYLVNGVYMAEQVVKLTGGILNEFECNTAEGAVDWCVKKALFDLPRRTRQ